MWSFKVRTLFLGFCISMLVYAVLSFGIGTRDREELSFDFHVDLMRYIRRDAPQT